VSDRLEGIWKKSFLASFGIRLTIDRFYLEGLLNISRQYKANMGSYLTLRSYLFSGKTIKSADTRGRAFQYVDSIAGIAGSKPTDGMDFHRLCLFCR
jgi:hypothetical protein